MSAPGRDETIAFAQRVLDQVIFPYMAEHEAGQHGLRDPAAAVTVVLMGLTRALVPMLVNARSDPAGRAALIATLAAALSEESAMWAAELDARAGGTLQ